MTNEEIQEKFIEYYKKLNRFYFKIIGVVIIIFIFLLTINSLNGFSLRRVNALDFLSKALL